MERKISLTEVINNIAPAGWVYLCDLSDWLSNKTYRAMSYKEREDLIQNIREIKTMRELKVA